MKTLPPARETTIYDALSRADIAFSGTSWNGFNVYGDEASVAEVRRLLLHEPSAEMIAAGASVLCGFDTSFEDEKSWAVRVYRAMRDRK